DAAGPDRPRRPERADRGPKQNGEDQRLQPGAARLPGVLLCALVLASNEAILAAVAQGGLLAAVSELAARPLIASGALVTIGPELPPRPFDLVRHPERRPSRAAAALLESL
ncbi:MAG TPA: LysR substrate-binding domain-containing protein, partial [Amaricoccus sp.]|nr:LysR substrate-binding domain-containing protein [Amaricoccus sp.]